MPETSKPRGFRGGPLLRYDEVGSTMDVARQLPASGAPTTVVAASQTAGRGRFDRFWVSPPTGGLYLTVRMPWTRPIQQAPLVSIGAALALARLSTDLGCRDVSLKWPNDLLIAGRKAAGILAEMLPEAESSSLLVGIGINVSIGASTLSTVGQPAISLCEACGHTLDLEQVLSAYLAHWSELDRILETQGFPPLAREFRKRSDLPGRRFVLSSGIDREDVEVRDILDDGSLEVEIVASGEIRRVFGGELLPLGSK